MRCCDCHTHISILEQIISAGQLRQSKESLCEVKTTATKTPKLSQNASKPLSEGRNLNIFLEGLGVYPDPTEDCRTHTYAYHHFSPQTQLLDRRHKSLGTGIWQVATYIPSVIILSGNGFTELEQGMSRKAIVTNWYSCTLAEVRTLSTWFKQAKE